MPRSRRAPPSGAWRLWVPMPAALRPALGPPPTCAPAAHVDMSEGSVVARAAVDADSARKLWMFFLDLLDGAQNDPRIARVHPAVVVEVRHPATAIVDVDVGGVAIHVPTELGATADPPAMSVIPRRAESAHYRHMLHFDAVLLKLSDDQFELVDEIFIQDEELGPNVSLIVGQKIGEPEVLRDLQVHVLGSDLDEAVRILVSVSR